MRLFSSFLALLVVCATTVALAWRSLGSAADGSAGAFAVAVLSIPVALFAFLLLARIIIKVSRRP
jgi:hypothetical protein